MSELAVVPLTNGMAAVIDAEDLELVRPYRWRAQKLGTKWYAVRSVWKDGRNSTVLMHRVILDAQKGQLVDHRNGDGLDNRRANLRFGDRSGNAANGKGYGGTSVYRGVHRKPNGRWAAFIRKDGKGYNLGYYDTQEAAARAYNAAAARLHGEFAYLNEVPDAA